MPINDLPNEILLQIANQLNIRTRYNLATTNRELFERISHLPLGRSFDIRNDTIIGSFFTPSIRAVNLYIDINDINYNTIQVQLASLALVRRITIFGNEDISVRVATRLLHRIPTYTFDEPLVLEVPFHSFHSFRRSRNSLGRFHDIRMIIVTQRQIQWRERARRLQFES